MLFSKKASPDYFFISIVFVLVIFGLVMLASASSDMAKNKFGDSYFYLKHQLLYGFSLGLLGFIFFYFFSYQLLKKLSLPLLIFSIAILLLVFSPLGFKAYGAERWLKLGNITFQPSEILKLTFLIYLSAWLSKNLQRSKSVTQGLLPFLFLVGTVTFLLILQPSTSTAVIIFAASVVMYFTSGAKFKFIAIAGLLSALVLSTVIYFTPYRLQRVLTFINPEIDQLGTSYHINKAMDAIGSGGLVGVGYGQSTTKLNYLPEPLSDSIFAVIGEEFGFVGSISLILLFFLFIWRGLLISKSAPDNFGRFLGTSFVSLIGIQAFINIGAISGTLPLTGVPLPFISYGGTALAVFLTMSGIIVSISKQRNA